MDDSETLKDKDYWKIIEQLHIFMEHLLPSDEDKQLLSKMVSECYRKHHRSIMAMEKDDPSLLTPLIMALIVDQNSMIERFKENKC